MATVVTICNLALSRIGDTASISSIEPPFKGPREEACARFYPMALKTCLELHNWSFATRRALLSELASSSVELGRWAHAFMLPADCGKVIDVDCPTGRGLYDPWESYETVGTDFGMVLLTDLPNVEVRYICTEPKASSFTGLFTDALAWLLGSYLAGETIRGDSAFNYAGNCVKQFQTMIASAMEQDARQAQVNESRKRSYMPEWIARR